MKPTAGMAMNVTSSKTLEKSQPLVGTRCRSTYDSATPPASSPTDTPATQQVAHRRIRTVIRAPSASCAAGRPGICSALAWISGKRNPKRSCNAAAEASCAAELSRPTGRAPRRASQAETYPVPQPSSRLSAPARSGGKIPSCASGTFHTPQPGSVAAQLRWPGPA